MAERGQRLEKPYSVVVVFKHKSWFIFRWSLTLFGSVSCLGVIFFRTGQWCTMTPFHLRMGEWCSHRVRPVRVQKLPNLLCRSFKLLCVRKDNKRLFFSRGMVFRLVQSHGWEAKKIWKCCTVLWLVFLDQEISHTLRIGRMVWHFSEADKKKDRELVRPNQRNIGTEYGRTGSAKLWDKKF